MRSWSDSTSENADRPVRRKIGRFTVELRSDSQRIIRNFTDLYSVEPREFNEFESPIRIDVRRVARSRLGRTLYRVFADGVEIGGWRPRSGVFPLIEWGINLRIIATRTEFLQLHAATLAYRGKGFLFAGDSGVGKSTLAAILLSRNWRYLCDEFALIEPRTLSLESFPKALCVKSGSIPTLKKLGLRLARNSDHIKGPKGRVGYLRPGESNPNEIGDPPPCRFVLFPTYHGGATPRLEPIPRTHAVLELFRCAFNRHMFGDATLDVLTRLVRESTCYRLEVGDPNATGELLESLVSPALSPLTTSVERTPRAAFNAGPRVTSPKSRREFLRWGAKLAYVAPAVATLSTNVALAATSDPSGICSTALNTGQLCQTDTDCCSRKCTVGVCQ